MEICYPPGADWSCAYSAEQLQEMRDDPDTLAQMERAEALAWTAMATYTADSVGTCPIVVRPCAAACSSAGTWTTAPVSSSGFFGGLAGRPGGFSPWVNEQGAWVNGCGCNSATACGCEALSEVILPGPVGKIEEVWLFGEKVDPITYRVDNGSRLVSLDPDRPWPTCQNLHESAHGAEAFSVTYYRGSAPSGVILYAVGTLATEFFRDCMGQECRLPVNLRSLSRNGVTADFEPEEGLTGLRDVDIVIRRLNPNLLKTRPRISSPDFTPRARQTTWS